MISKLSVQELAYDTEHHIGETQGHNLEAVLPGKSPNSVVIIVHYDSIGPERQKKPTIPGVDDDMSGMATLMETARILVEHKAQLQNTRFALWRRIMKSMRIQVSRAHGNMPSIFRTSPEKKILKLSRPIDNEQSGWNCVDEGDHACEERPDRMLLQDDWHDVRRFHVFR